MEATTDCLPAPPNFLADKKIDNTTVARTASSASRRVIMLCYSADEHYDPVYSKDHIANLALVQSILYELLYHEVFNLKVRFPHWLLLTLIC